jgi:hypothetical protein
MKKKMYIELQMSVVKLVQHQSLLTGSTFDVDVRLDSLEEWDADDAD